MQKHINIPIFIPHEGCPNDCVFCNQRKISGHLQVPTKSEIVDTIEHHLLTIGTGDVCEIAFFGGSFTGLPTNVQEMYLSLAAQYVNQGRVSGIRLSTRPDYINEEILSLLKKYHVKVIELGIQSLDSQVLQKSKRFYSPEEALSACRLVKQHGFSLGAQTMIGLPEDTLEKSLLTARKIIDIQPDMVRIYPTLVIRGTELETQYEKGQYKPLTLDEAVSWCSVILPLYEEANIQVLRIGLQHTENLKQGLEVVAGPVHSAFGELVYSKIWLDRITRAVKQKQIHDQALNRKMEQNKLVIHVAPSKISMVIGQHRENLKILKKFFGFTSIKVLCDWQDDRTFHLEFF